MLGGDLFCDGSHLSTITLAALFELNGNGQMFGGLYPRRKRSTARWWLQIACDFMCVCGKKCGLLDSGFGHSISLSGSALSLAR